MTTRHPQGSVRGRRHCSPLLDDPAWLRRRYVTDGALISEIAAELGVSNTTVNNSLADHSIARRAAHGNTPVRYPQLRDPSYMVRMLVRRRETILGLARILGCAEKTVREATRREPVADALEAAGWDPVANSLAAGGPGPWWYHYAPGLARYLR